MDFYFRVWLKCLFKTLFIIFCKIINNLYIIFIKVFKYIKLINTYLKILIIGHIKLQNKY